MDGDNTQRLLVRESAGSRCNWSLVLLLVQYIIYVLALIMTVIALGLLADLQSYIDAGNRPSCIVSLLFASIATVCLIMLAILGLVKLTLRLNNKVFKILDIALLAVTLPLVIIMVIIVSSGWAVTCKSLSNLFHGGSCELIEFNKMTMAAIFASIGSVLVMTGLIISVVLIIQKGGQILDNTSYVYINS